MNTQSNSFRLFFLYILSIYMWKYVTFVFFNHFKLYTSPDNFGLFCQLRMMSWLHWNAVQTFLAVIYIYNYSLMFNENFSSDRLRIYGIPLSIIAVFHSLMCCLYLGGKRSLCSRWTGAIYSLQHERLFSWKLGWRK